MLSVFKPSPPPVYVLYYPLPCSLCSSLHLACFWNMPNMILCQWLFLGIYACLLPHFFHFHMSRPNIITQERLLTANRKLTIFIIYIIYTNDRKNGGIIHIFWLPNYNLQESKDFILYIVISSTLRSQAHRNTKIFIG